MQWYLQVLKKYAVFSGRARRKEYWMFVLFNILIAMGLGFIDGITGMASEGGMGVLGGLYNLAILIPSLAVAVRRLHDTGRSGWYLLIAFIPIIGGLILLFFMIQEGEGANQYGENPKHAEY